MSSLFLLLTLLSLSASVLCVSQVSVYSNLADCTSAFTYVVTKASACVPKTCAPLGSIYTKQICPTLSADTDTVYTSYVVNLNTGSALVHSYSDSFCQQLTSVALASLTQNCIPSYSTSNSLSVSTSGSGSSTGAAVSLYSQTNCTGSVTLSSLSMGVCQSDPRGSGSIFIVLQTASSLLPTSAPSSGTSVVPSSTYSPNADCSSPTEVLVLTAFNNQGAACVPMSCADQSNGLSRKAYGATTCPTVGNTNLAYTNYAQNVVSSGVLVQWFSDSSCTTLLQVAVQKLNTCIGNSPTSSQNALVSNGNAMQISYTQPNCTGVAVTATYALGTCQASTTNPGVYVYITVSLACVNASANVILAILPVLAAIFSVKAF